MPLPTVQPARFVHEAGDTSLRLQVFLRVQDADGGVCTVRIEDHPDRWLLPAEMLHLDEDPDAGAQRVAETYFDTPVEGLQLSRVLSYPPEEDEEPPRWYLLFVYDAPAPEGLEGTPDTLELALTRPPKAPGPFAFDHGTVWEDLAD